MIGELICFSLAGLIAIAIILEVSQRIMDRKSEHFRFPLSKMEDAAERIRRFEMMEKLRDEAERELQKHNKGEGNDGTINHVNPGRRPGDPDEERDRAGR